MILKSEWKLRERNMYNGKFYRKGKQGKMQSSRMGAKKKQTMKRGRERRKGKERAREGVISSQADEKRLEREPSLQDGSRRQLGKTSRTSILIRLGEELDHGGIVQDNSTQDCEVPEVMAGSEVVKHPRPPPLRHLHRVEHSTGTIHGQGPDDGEIEVEGPGEAPDEDKVNARDAAGGGKTGEEQDAQPGKFGPIEDGMPGHDGSADTERGGDTNVRHFPEGIAVKCSVLGGDDRSSDQHRNTSVVDAGKTLHCVLVSDAVEGVP